MYVTTVRNRTSPPAVLLRESYRDGAKVKNRTLANLSDWPEDKIEALRALLRGDKLVPAGQGVEIVRSLPYGHVAATLGVARRIRLDRLITGSERTRDLIQALIVARLIEPAAKLATARALDADTASTGLGAALGLGGVAANEIYEALDWLGRFAPARLTGTGSCVFSACGSAIEAERLAARVPDRWTRTVARGLNASPLLLAWAAIGTRALRGL